MLEPGAVFGDYTFGRVLGAGGLGTVYLGHHNRLARDDAVKVFEVDTAVVTSVRSLFERECDRAARLRHPNIVPVLDHGVEDNRLWLATAFVDGIDVATLIAERRQLLDREHVARILVEVAAGLDHAHAAGVLHRDVKPADILVDADRASVRDFGITRTLTGSGRLTEIGDPIATLAYASPEQLSGQVVDPHTDVYGLGCVLFEMLTGSTPFARADLLGIVNAHLHELPPHPSESVPDLPSAIDGVIARALAKKPDDRYPTCTDLADDAARALTKEFKAPSRRPPVAEATPTATATGAAAPPSTTETSRSWRRPAAIVAALVAAAAVAVGIVVAVRVSGDDAAPPRGSSGASTIATAASPTMLSHAGYTETSMRIHGSTANATYDVTLPQIAGRNRAAVGTFNQAMLSTLQDQIGGYPGEAFTLTGEGSRVVHIGDHVVSGLLRTSWDSDPPGAHPSPLVATAVIDTDSAQKVTLDNLFPDTAAGLQRLSTEAARLLPATAAGADFDRGGIEPTEANFRNWLATPQGMNIEFDDYQVAPRAAGIVAVTVPWDRLTDVTDTRTLDLLRS